MSKNVQLSFGSDPEFMLVDRDGNYKSAIGIVNGTKEKKVDLGGGHKMFYDNVLCEFNVKSGNSEDEVIGNFSDLFRRAAKALHPFTLRPQASHLFPAKECQHPDARVFGCEPEFCAYEMTQLNPPTCEVGNTFRSAGGHIHLGYTAEAYPLLAPVANKDTDDEDRSERDWGRVWVIRMMDLFVGLPSLFVDHDPTSAPRRKLYGKAGTHRPKEEYGVEYRATSNFWLQSPKLTSLVYRLSARTVELVAERVHDKLWKDQSTSGAYDVDLLRRTIDNSDQKAARKIMEDVVKKYLPAELYKEIFTLAEPIQYNFYREWGV